MSDEKVPRFLQQTESQLRHQQEALRKRREMLERESLKPPAMRFGTGSPPRCNSRHGKSPVPSSSSASHSTPPRGDNVRRELNWSRSEDVATAERAPMRFSVAFRPGPSPSCASGRPRTTTTAGTASTTAVARLHVPPSPSPREVNTADQVSGVACKASRDTSTPRTVSPRSPPPQRARVEEVRDVAAENRHRSSSSKRAGRDGASQARNVHVSVQVFAPTPKSSNEAGEGPAEGDDAIMERGEQEGEEEREMSRLEKRRFLPLPPPFTATPQTGSPVNEAEGHVKSDTDTTGIAGFSNTFPVPRFTPIIPSTSKQRTDATTAEEEEEQENTPGRPAVGEFRTPLPVTRMSTSLTPVIDDGTASTARSAILPANSDALLTENQNNSKGGNGLEEDKSASAVFHGAREGASPAPTPSQLFASLEASTEKRRGAPATPAVSREREEHRRDDVRDSKSPSCAFQTSASRSVELRTPSPTRRTKASPAPTAQDLIQSVQASADRRPCGCKRPTPSLEHWRRTHSSPSSCPTASPAPMPVPLSDKPMTDFDSPHHKCCDRPTPVSLSSQPAGGEARVTVAPSTSPWPTTENIINSILACTQEEQRRAREDDDDDDDGAMGGRAGQDSRHCEAVGGEAHVEMAEEEATVKSPTATAPPTFSAQQQLSPTTATHTPSPTPTPEHVIASLQASAEKRARSAALVMTKTSNEASNNGSCTDSGSPNSKAFQSPMLTPQNVKDSIQKLVGDRQCTRSDAQAPRRPWGESGPNASNAEVNASASPVVTAADVDVSLATLEQDQRRQSRSVRGARDTSQPSTTSHKDGGDNGRNSSCSSDAHSGAAGGSHSALSPPVAMASPAPSGFVTQSAMFFDCDSAPVTPSLPAVEAAVVVSVAQSTTTTATVMRVATAASPHVPAQFLELQREISAIKEGRRSRTCTPLPLHASEVTSPVPPSTAQENVEDAAREEASLELPLSPPGHITTTEEGQQQQHRSSLVLVQPTRGHQTLLQRPHEPAPAMPPPRISPVRIPRTPTPPSRAAQSALTARRESLPHHFETLAHTDAQSGTSPLPRPVSLRSQVSLPKRPFSQQTVRHPRSPVPAWATATPPAWPLSSLRDEYALHAEEDVRIGPLPAMQSDRDVLVGRSNNSEKEEEDLFDSKNDWMDLVEPLRAHTITVSPQSGRALLTTHSSQRGDDSVGNEKEGAQEKEKENEQQQQQEKKKWSLSSPPVTRQCSRSNSLTPPFKSSAAAQHAAAATPASATLTMDDSASTGVRSSSADLLMHTPSAPVSQTPHSSKRGRRSQAEELLAMLPADVIAEVARIEAGDSDDVHDGDDDVSLTRPSTGSPASRLSGFSEGADSTTAQTSTISQRVSQRPPRVTRSSDDYLEFLEGITRSSAKKVRAAAGRRMQKAITKDLAAAQRRAGKGIVATPATTTAAAATSAAAKAVATTPASPYSSLSNASSPLAPPLQQHDTDGRGAGQSQLKVSMRLSTELQQSLFRGSPAKATPQKSPRRAAAAAAPLSAARKTTKKAKRGTVAPPKRGSRAKVTKSSPKSSPTPAAKVVTVEVNATAPRGRRGKKAARKFVTAKSLRSVKHLPHSKKQH